MKRKKMKLKGGRCNMNWHIPEARTLGVKKKKKKKERNPIKQGKQIEVDSKRIRSKK
jgi:hypothetical protein